MKKLFAILMLGFMVLFVAGCTTTQNGTGKSFLGGTEGLKAEFMTGSPPEFVTDGDSFDFSVILNMQNLGESDIEANEGYVQLSRLEPSAFGKGVGDLKKNFGDVRGAKMNYDSTRTDGSVFTVDFTGFKYKNTIQGDITQKIAADVCYNYKTRSTATLCVKKGIDTGDTTKGCKIEGEKNPENSGAPIHITSLQENFAGSGRIDFRVKIEHVGTGDAFFKHTASVCDDSITNPNLGIVYVEFKPITVEGKTVTPECSGFSETTAPNKGFVRLLAEGTGKESRTLSCRLNTGDNIQSDYDITLNAEITYKYLTHIEKDVRIRHVPK